MSERRATRDSRDDFERAVQGPVHGFFSEFCFFLCHNRKWWLTPIILMMLLISVFIVLGGTGAAPFIYTLF